MAQTMDVEGKKLSKAVSMKEFTVDVPPVDVQNRRCTDILFLVIFALYWLGMIVVTVIGTQQGDPRRLVYGTDNAGRVCGGDELPDKPYTVYPRTAEDALLAGEEISRTEPWNILFFGVCVSECPKEGDFVCTVEAEALVANKSAELSRTRNDIIESCVKNPLVIFTTIGTNCPSQEIYKGCFDTLFNTTAFLQRCFPKYTYEIKVMPESGCVEYKNTTTLFNSVVSTCVKYKEVKQTTTIEPTGSDLLFDSFNTAARIFQRYIGDVYIAYPVILVGGLGFTIIIGFVYIVALFCLIGPIVWGSVIGCVIVSLCLTLYCYFKAGLIDAAFVQVVADTLGNALDDAKGVLSSTAVTITGQDLLNGGSNVTTVNTTLASGSAIAGLFASSNDYKRQYEIGAYFLTAVTVLLTIIIIAMIGRINRAIEIFREASSAIRATPGIILLPVLSMVLMLSTAAYWAYSTAYMASAGSLTLTWQNQTYQAPVDPDTVVLEVAGFTSVSNLDLFLVYLFFGFLWTINFIAAVVTMITAGAVTTWYWAGSGEQRGFLSKFTVLRSVYVVFRFHLGSLAFGSILVAIVQLLRYIAAYIDAKSQELQKENYAVKVLMCCVHCCLKCMEMCVKFISRNAYIMVSCARFGFAALPVEPHAYIVPPLPNSTDGHVW